MSDRLQEMAVFLRVADTGSFSRAARDLGFSQSSVSRILAELEARLGVTLMLRTTRRVTLTQAGAVFLAHARALVSGFEEAEDAARGVDSLRGTLRIALPATFGNGVVIPRLPPFLAAHPELRIALLPSDDVQDLVGSGVDLAIRFGPLADSGFGARRLATVPRLAVASPAYLAASGRPLVPEDLARHDCVFGPGLMARQHWSFANAKPVADRLHARVEIVSAEGVMACATAGLGVAIGSAFLCEPGLRSGALVTVLDRFPLRATDLHAIFPAGPHPSRKVRTFVDYLEGLLASPAGRG